MWDVGEMTFTTFDLRPSTFKYRHTALSAALGLLVGLSTGCGDDDGGEDAAVRADTSTDAPAADSSLENDSGASPLCMDTCGPSGSPGEWAGDGECDDGGSGSTNSSCALGTDCMDCGSRTAGSDAGTGSDSGTFDSGPPDSGPVDSGPTCDPEATSTFACDDSECNASQVCLINSVGGNCYDLEFRCAPCSSQYSDTPGCTGSPSISGNSIEGCVITCD